MEAHVFPKNCLPHDIAVVFYEKDDYEMVMRDKDLKENWDYTSSEIVWQFPEETSYEEDEEASREKSREWFKEYRELEMVDALADEILAEMGVNGSEDDSDY